jgi:hypothetical protein
MIDRSTSAELNSMNNGRLPNERTEPENAPLAARTDAVDEGTSKND